MVRISQASQAVNSNGEQLVEVCNTLLSCSDSTTHTLLSGVVTVDGSATTQPVSLTGVVTVDGSSVTQPVSISGTVATTTSATVVSGTNNNHLSNQTISSGFTSTGFDVSSAKTFSIMGNTTEQSSSIIVEFSPDNTNWYIGNIELYPAWSDPSTPYDFYQSFDSACVKYVRLNFSNYTTLTEVVNCTILTQ